MSGEPGLEKTHETHHTPKKSSSSKLYLALSVFIAVFLVIAIIVGFCLALKFHAERKQLQDAAQAQSMQMSMMGQSVNWNRSLYQGSLESSNVDISRPYSDQKVKWYGPSQKGWSRASATGSHMSQVPLFSPIHSSLSSDSSPGQRLLSYSPVSGMEHSPLSPLFPDMQNTMNKGHSHNASQKEVMPRVRESHSQPPNVGQSPDMELANAGDTIQPHHALQQEVTSQGISSPAVLQLLHQTPPVKLPRVKCETPRSRNDKSPTHHK